MKTSSCFAAALAVATTVTMSAQGPPGRGAGAPASARASAPVDLTGYWVSIVTEDWIERMSPDSPPSGVGRGGRGQFDPTGGAGIDGPAGAAAAAKGEPCRAYGAAGFMRVPGRVNITWQDDNTLKVEMDSGTQTRLFHFGNAPAPAARTLQGHSVAAWDIGGRGGRGGRGGGGRGAAPAPPAWGSLRVVTTNMTGGYLLSSRASYSENAVLTEHFTKHTSLGVDYFTVTAIVEDGPLTRISSSTFKKEPNGAKFAPTGCEVVR
jgi:hypothetical protein